MPFLTMISRTRDNILDYMLQGKAKDKVLVGIKKNNGKKDITRLIFDIADFGFSLKDLSGSIEKMKDLVKKYTDATGCTIMFLDNYGYLWKVGEKTTYPFELGEGVAGQAAMHKKTIFISDIQKDKKYKPLYGSKPGAIISIPIIKNSETLGVLNLTFSKYDKDFCLPPKNILNIFAKKMESILENVILYYVAKGERNELRIRKAISTTLGSNAPLSKKIEDLRNETAELLGVRGLAICVASTEKKFLLCYKGGKKQKKISGKNLLDIYSEKKGKEYDFLDLSEALDFEFILTKGSGYVTMYPIFSKKKIAGYILLEDEVKNTENISILERSFIDLISRKIGAYIDSQSSSKKIIAEKERWKTIFHNANDGIIILSKDKTIIEANLKAREILGIKKAYINGKSLFSLFKISNPEIESPTLSTIKNINKLQKNDEYEELSKKINNLFTSHKTIRSKEYYIKAKSGKYWITLSAELAKQDAKSGTYGIIHIKDITKNKEVEADKNEFMSMVSHELRTPLTAMKGYLSMTLNDEYGTLNKKQERFLRRVEESNERMVALVEDILDVSRIELGKFNLCKEPVNLSDVICDMVGELGVKMQEKKVAMILQGKKMKSYSEVQKAPKRKCKEHNTYVLADRDRLMQILRNLIDNAVKYSFDGGKVEINVRSDESFAEISIKDNGVGVAKEDQHKLFRRFSRVHNPLSIQAGGTGLGLYITRKLVLAHDGSIDVISKKDEGTTFLVKIPMAKQLPLI